MKQSITIEKFNYDTHSNLAEQAIEAQASEHPDMLGFSLEKFQNYPLAVIAHLACEEFVGFNAVIYEYPKNKTVEIGGLYIAPEHRGNGYTWPIKKQLHTLVRQKYAGWRPITFTNALSTPINQRLGYIPTDDAPAEALENCKECSSCNALKAGQICCHTILELPSH